jgi:hypothetical protein
MKNWKLGTKITLGITIIVIICMSLLYLTANKTMTGMMQESEGLSNWFILCYKVL